MIHSLQLTITNSPRCAPRRGPARRAACRSDSSRGPATKKVRDDEKTHVGGGQPMKNHRKAKTNKTLRHNIKKSVGRRIGETTLRLLAVSVFSYRQAAVSSPPLQIILRAYCSSIIYQVPIISLLLISRNAYSAYQYQSVCVLRPFMLDVYRKCNGNGNDPRAACCDNNVLLSDI